MRHGTAGARMQEIAREAGVNSALLHYYFRNKERLADAVFQQAATQLLPHFVRILASYADLDAKVASLVARATCSMTLRARASISPRATPFIRRPKQTLS